MEYTKEYLQELLDTQFINNSNAFSSGRRNDDAVDLCCICRSLDIDPWKVFKDIMQKQNYVNLEPAKKAMGRVTYYANNWGTVGTFEPMQWSINY